MAGMKTDEATKKAVVEYYDGSWFDYRVIWLNRGNLAKHFGYWEPGIKTHSASLLNMNVQVAARVNPKAGERVLDAGCGIGGSSIWMAQTYGVTTVGISLSAKELERARKYTHRPGPAGPVLLRAAGLPRHDLPRRELRHRLGPGVELPHPAEGSRSSRRCSGC